MDIILHSNNFDIYIYILVNIDLEKNSFVKNDQLNIFFNLVRILYGFTRTMTMTRYHDKIRKHMV